ncbi:MAG TPA: hypothetical protein PK867_03890 [Pirellulales bacterium]|nr:hypothetical protein [Pirellulales bacterium]
MNHRVQSFTKALANVSRLWAENDFEAALKEAEDLLEAWKGNAHLHILRASLIQLQEHPTSTLDDAKQALQDAIDLDTSSPAAAIELGHFLDAVEDDPRAASKVYTKALGQARRLLIEGLIGQAKALLQLEKRDEALRCVTELLQLTHATSAGKRSKSASGPDIIMRSSTGKVSVIEVQGPYATEVEQLVNEVMATR